MNIFLAALERLTGRRARHETPSASIPPGTAPYELEGFVRMTRKATRDPIELIPGKPHGVIMHSDIDPATGRVYPDFEARRRARHAKEDNPWLRINRRIVDKDFRF